MHHTIAMRRGVEFSHAAKGIVGLETMLPLSLELVRAGVFDIPAMVRAMSYAPAQNLGLERGTLRVGAVADVAVFDPDKSWTMVPGELASKSHNTPFGGWGMTGKVVRTFVAGRSVWEDNQ